MQVHFSKLNGDKRSVTLGFSLFYFLFGPLYLFWRLFIVRFFILLPIYLIGIWPKCLVHFGVWLNTLGVETKFTNFLAYPYEYKLYAYIAIGLIHLVVSLIVPRIEVKRLLKKAYVPFSELDTQKLIKHNLVQVGTQSYLSSFAPIDGVGREIKVKTVKDFEFHLEQLKRLLQSGMISKDEYNTKRALIIMEKQ